MKIAGKLSWTLRLKMLICPTSTHELHFLTFNRLITRLNGRTCNKNLRGGPTANISPFSFTQIETTQKNAAPCRGLGWTQLSECIALRYRHKRKLSFEPINGSLSAVRKIKKTLTDPSASMFEHIASRFPTRCVHCTSMRKCFRWSIAQFAIIKSENHFLYFSKGNGADWRYVERSAEAFQLCK